MDNSLDYVSPHVEVLEVQVEQGFAGSGYEGESGKEEWM